MGLEMKEPFHKSKLYALKQVNVDICIAPLIKWMNSLEVFTMACCQGDNLKQGYIWFAAKTVKDLEPVYDLFGRSNVQIVLERNELFRPIMPWTLDVRFDQSHLKFLLKRLYDWQPVWFEKEEVEEIKEQLKLDLEENGNNKEAEYGTS